MRMVARFKENNWAGQTRHDLVKIGGHLAAGIADNSFGGPRFSICPMRVGSEEYLIKKYELSSLPEGGAGR